MRAGGLCIHGTCVSFRGAGLLIVGPSGAGKSSLAAELIVSGAELVADDIVILSETRDEAIASAPSRPTADAKASATFGLELRGLGLAPVPIRGPAPLRAVLLLGPAAARLPAEERAAIGDLTLPLLRHPYGIGLAAKLHLWLEWVQDGLAT